MFNLVRKFTRRAKEMVVRWEVKRVEFTRLAGELSLCAKGRVLTSPFRGAPLRVFFVPREEEVSTWGYIRCSKVNGAVELPPTIVLGGRPQFLSELEPLFEFHPEERLILEFHTRPSIGRFGKPLLRIVGVSVRSSMRSVDLGVGQEALN